MANRWRDWLVQAEHDLKHAIASHEQGDHDWACFASHQAAEKAVKALHMAQGRQVWGHVTARLLNQLPDPPPSEVIERARFLDTLYVPARYPNGHADGPAFEHYGPLHSSQAIDNARTILNHVRASLADS